MRIIPWRNYDQMIADGNLPPLGHPDRLAIIMDESYKRGLCQGAIVCVALLLAWFLYH